jgi:hypothetical protein
MAIRTTTTTLFCALVFSLAGLLGCSSDDGGTGGTGGSSGGGSSGGSSSSSGSCSSQSESTKAYLCIGSGDSMRCKCASSKEDRYPYSEDEADRACSSGSSSQTGDCPDGVGGGGSGGGDDDTGGFGGGGDDDF